MMSESEVPVNRKNKHVGLMKKSDNSKARYNNRKDCIMKKSRELATLCGVQVCTVCVGPDGKVETWPKNSSQVKNVLNTYSEYVKFGKKSKRNSKNSSKWNTDWLLGLSGEKKKNLVGDIESKLGEINTRIDLLKQKEREINQPPDEQIVLGANCVNNASYVNDFEMNNASLVNEPNYPGNFSRDLTMSYQTNYENMNLEDFSVADETNYGSMYWGNVSVPSENNYQSGISDDFSGANGFIRESVIFDDLALSNETSNQCDYSNNFRKPTESMFESEFFLADESLQMCTDFVNCCDEVGFGYGGDFNFGLGLATNNLA